MTYAIDNVFKGKAAAKDQNEAAFNAAIASAPQHQKDRTIILSAINAAIDLLPVIEPADQPGVDITPIRIKAQGDITDTTVKMAFIVGIAADPATTTTDPAATPATT